MSQNGRSKSRGRAAPEPAPSFFGSLLRELGLDLSWPVAGLTLLVLALGFGPLLLLGLFDIQGVARKIMIVIGPALVCIAFTLMTYYFGMRYADEGGMSRAGVWFLTGLFVVLGILGCWGLFVSV